MKILKFTCEVIEAIMNILYAILVLGILEIIIGVLSKWLVTLSIRQNYQKRTYCRLKEYIDKCTECQNKSYAVKTPKKELN